MNVRDQQDRVWKEESSTWKLCKLKQKEGVKKLRRLRMPMMTSCLVLIRMEGCKLEEARQLEMVNCVILFT